MPNSSAGVAVKVFASICAGIAFVVFFSFLFRFVLLPSPERVASPWSERELIRKAGIVLNQMDLDELHVSPALQARLAELDVERVFSDQNFENFPEDYGSGFRLKPHHVDLVRQVRLTWDDVENGAPKVLADRPFGQDDPLTAMADLLNLDTAEAQARAYGEMRLALTRFLMTARLAPGTYALRNVTAEQLFDSFDGFYLNAELVTSPDDVGIDANGHVLVDQDVLKLIREMVFYWPSEDDMQDHAQLGEWPVPHVNGKRPYAQSTWHETDMHEILTGKSPEENEAGDVVFPEGRERQLTMMHFRTLAVMQVFFENAVLPASR